ncbi:MAG: alpha/beta hydrolase [Ardenticatenia bacterium]|nr:MAG: alpha/beta hydrolase [Ardenticatenia bacterium]
MSHIPHLDGITCRMVETPRGRFHLLECGPADGEPVVFVHGNVSSATFWEELMLALPPTYRAVAYDQRGYGESARLPVDATRGLRDFSDDLSALVDTLDLDTFHLIGHSMGGGVAMQYTIEHPERVRTLTVVCPVSPYGYGGTKGLEGERIWPDGAGSGAGVANPEFVQRLAAGDRSTESPASPRNVLRTFYGKAPFIHPREEALLDAMLSTAVGPDHYPGDSTPSAHWPGVAPGTRGINNTMAPIYCNLSGIVAITPKPPLLWVRGADDQIVSDTSMFDIGYLGKLGLVPGWPGEDVYPPQPMVSQTRAVFQRYAEQGGRFREVVIEDAGHSPYLERPDEFQAAWFAWLEES